MSGSDSDHDDKHGRGGPTTIDDVKRALNAAIGALIAEFDAAKPRTLTVKALTHVTASGTDDDRHQYRASWFVKNRFWGAVSKSVRGLDAQSYPAVEAVFAGALMPLYKDVRVPLWLCALIGAELVRRVQGVNAVAAYNKYCRSSGVMLGSALEAARAAAPARSDATQYEVVLTGKKVTKAVAGAATEDGHERQSAGRQRKVNVQADIANLIGRLLRARVAAGAPPAIPLAELRAECLSTIPQLATRRAATQQPEAQLRVFRGAISRVVAQFHKLEARGLLAPETAAQCDRIALTQDAVVDLSALVSAAANATVAAPATTFHSDPTSDRCFRLLVHLLKANFRFKKPASDAPPGMEYRGHNICCVAYETETGRLVAMDFNQCKADQNLCSHAEKRMMEALTHSLRPTVAKGTPPSLARYTVISSLEPCHMCANFVARMGVSRIGYLMRDPMQKDALEAAARMLDLTLIRPSEVALCGTLEAAFADANVAGTFPPEEITSWLGSDLFITLLQQLAPQYPLDEVSTAFLNNIGSHYPGCVDLAALPPGAISGAAATSDADLERGPSPTDTVAHMPRSSTDILTDALVEDVEPLSDTDSSEAPSTNAAQEQNHEDPFAFL